MVEALMQFIYLTAFLGVSVIFLMFVAVLGSTVASIIGTIRESVKMKHKE
jgi:hypothetical protein